MDEVQEQKENLKGIKSMETIENSWPSRRWNKVIKEKGMVIIKKEKEQ